MPSSSTSEIGGVRLTNPDKVLYPEQGVTKRELALYYRTIAEWVVPHVARRPLTLVRCPAGSGKTCFFQKHVGSGVPDEVQRIEIPEGAGTTGDDAGGATYLYINDCRGLVALAQIGALEIHPWGSTIDALETPDRMVFDLDPDPGLPWGRVVEAAVAIRDDLDALGLQSFVKTTGGKGLHVIVPLAPRLGWDDVKAFAHGFAAAMVDESPDRYTTNPLKKERVGKVFLDYLRNGRGATAIAAYSTRARPGATVATPLAWSELGKSLDPLSLHIRSVPERLAHLTRDPWADLAHIEQEITSKAMKAVGLR
jgi:bifunctional non-homologous end joining protein LigD